MTHDPDQRLPHVYPDVDGERSTAGSNYGDWRPEQPRGPHGYDFEARFTPPEQDPDFARLRAEYERELDARHPNWRDDPHHRFADDFGRWRELRATTGQGGNDPRDDQGLQR
ncbi:MULTISPECIES: hypothetical protein [unclassified Roseateles]|uniref:hypothetical protein n=1 Tax=unclassified Roseateles TaxID=2626991 RepID=UPI0007131B63|nr:MULTISPECIES: hypothetical protein [unclassified Roseateles]KQW52038.1 hypothetical protein ASC81_05425 [Pelomonas sp. Root405]KRA78272.1 hypothetical protein ASD88_05430 [Pelomonas sp. Root662]